ncbi:DNA-binding transcriptional LysR family regulator [Sporomusaceae bacterium BoRhaA]|uniref:LysR family transcriptional regulator n=1 Tax=Pelorhabdus rhamnosifermentans TaxID=2772457 RepID=UPI001C062615|nr:LysR family transcriptional regulator [Pelorhabdus rhamnosifermentans]MBU2699988.1 DNA-binding transcriptional LysR family regulator [Pelorhabdus rhamnosifermentans]
MQIHDIQAFLAVVRTKNISRAAEEMYLSQSTITHRLKNLELTMGVTLLDRGRGMKNIYLTPSGKDFLQIAKRWDVLWKETEFLKKQGDHMALSFGTLESLNLSVFPSLFISLSQHIPKIRLEIHTQHTDDLYSSVERRQIDVAFVLREIFSPNIKKEPWATAPMVLLKTSNPSEAEKIMIDNNNLNADNEVYTPWSGTNFTSWHDQWWDPTCRYRINITGVNLILTLLQDVEKWAIVPMWLAQYATKLGNFSYYRLSNPPPDLICYKITHKFPKPSTQRSLLVLNEYLKNIKIS